MLLSYCSLLVHHFRWLVRNLASVRSAQTKHQMYYAFVVTVYLLFFVLWIPKYTAVQIVPFYICGWAVHLALVLFLVRRSRWTPSLLSNAVTLVTVLLSALVALGGFTRLNPSPATAAACLSGTKAAVEEYENDDPGPLLLALVALSSAAGPHTGGSVVPATSQNAVSYDCGTH